MEKRRALPPVQWLAGGILICAMMLLSACAGAPGGETTPGASSPIPVATEGGQEASPPAAPVEETSPPAQTAPVNEPTTPSATTMPATTDTPAGEPGNPTETQSGQPGVPTDSVTAFPDPAGYVWAPVTSGLVRPLDLASPPDGSGRLFILEQPGAIRILQEGSLLPEPFLDITEKVQSGGNEQGLLGIAFHPDYAQNGYFYINYTGYSGTGDTFIARYQASQEDPNRADPDSELILLQVQQPYRNHNGGGLAFGPDGYLYIALGDGGSANDPQGNGQSLDTHLGKLLRVDVDGGEPYAVPADNPFASGGGLPEIWAYGLRNPWRFSFDRLTGDLYIADVGQNQWEEIDFLPAGAGGGANFGWDYREGAHPFEGTPPGDLDLIDPIFEFDHGLGCSVTGGYVYRGEALPEFRGIYLFSDYCSGRVWGLLRGQDGGWQSAELFQTGWSVSSFGLDRSGEIYLIDQAGGAVYRLESQ